MEEDAENQFKVIIIGESEVGKTSIMIRYTENTFGDNLLRTEGISKFEELTKNYYSDAEVILVVFANNNLQSFNLIKDFWIDYLENKTSKDALKILVQNKMDLNINAIEDNLIINLSTKFHKYIEISAKNGDKINLLFDHIAEILNRRTKPIIDLMKTNISSMNENINYTDIKKTENKNNFTLDKNNNEKNNILENKKKNKF